MKESNKLIRETYFLIVNALGGALILKVWGSIFHKGTQKSFFVLRSRQGKKMSLVYILTVDSVEGGSNIHLRATRAGFAPENR